MPSVTRPPNVILILADDLGYGDLACFGHNACDTPCTDALAASGLTLTDFHANGPVCSPTRAALLTGRYQQRCGIEGALGENDPGLSGEAFTLSRLLSENGYATGLFGKWHLGMADHESPNAHCFDQFRGHRHGAVDYFSHVNKYGCIDWWCNDKRSDEDGYCTDIIARHSVDFIHRHAEQPFFLFMSHSAIHFPWMAPDDMAHRRPGVRYDDLSRVGPHGPDEVGPVVRKMIQSLDSTVGQIDSAVTDAGIREDTLILFTSDNGGIETFAGGYHDISSNGGLRGQKGSLYEGGHRVPAIVHWPGRVREGAIDQQPMTTMDLMPTMAGLAGIELDDRAAMDGADLAAAWLEGSELAPRDLFWRSGEQRAVRRGPWKFYCGGETDELYHLEDDVKETRNRAELEPKRVAAMRTALDAWERDVDESCDEA